MLSNPRQLLLQNWLQTTGALTQPIILQPLVGDASFRRYFRILQPSGSFIAADAPPATENSAAYIAIASALRQHGIPVPEVIASDISQGFLLLSDFGDQLLLNTLNLQNAEKFYQNALRILANMQSCQTIPHWKLPVFTAEFMYNELQLFKEWFLQKHLGLSIDSEAEKKLNQFFSFLANSAASQPYVFMHRDYHSANLMVLPDQELGVLDFQDAFIGPVTYDVVSLLRDCYIDFPDIFIKKCVLFYRDQLNLAVSDNEFIRWFDLMGLQRHLKALLTFARKYHRDGQANYLKHIPRTLSYIQAVSARYEEAGFFQGIISLCGV